MHAPTPISQVDAALLASLERAFAAHAGSAAAIDLPHLQKALGLRSEYLARRVLAAFDRDGNGTISYDEFLAGVRRMVFGTDREKLELAFAMHDDDGDGALSELDLTRMIAIALGESGIVASDRHSPEAMARALIRNADRDGDGRISLDELHAVMSTHPELLATMVRAEAAWIAPNEALLARLDRKAGRGRDERAGLGRWIGNHRALVVVTTLWVLGQLALFAASMANLATYPATDVTTQLGRAAAYVAAFDGALLLLPMSRRLLARIRSGIFGRLLPIDEAIELHRYLGHALFLWSTLHAAALVVAHAGGHPKAPFGLFLVQTLRGVTGLLLWVIFAVMWLFAWKAIRRTRRFELFYFTHLLYVVWLPLAIVHAPSFALWIGAPLAIFVLELVVRLRRRAVASRAELTALRSGVVRLTMPRPAGFAERAGDYVFLRIPSLAKHEWHPFTLSSAPESPALTVHVRSLGNWTAALRTLAESMEKRGAQGARESVPIFIDGPYGTPSRAIFESEVAILVGAGIGVTPFASILESIVRRRGSGARAPSHVSFFWLNRDPYSFEWFVELLREIEREAERGAGGSRIDMHLCMTDGRSDATAVGLEIARALMRAEGHGDLITGLGAHTHFGPPDWPTVLEAIVKAHAGKRVELFFCGPPGLGRKLEPLCHARGIGYHEEKF
jgi:predicted ferric reductase/Ca2+-binding EF-hand superfamily protein